MIWNASSAFCTGFSRWLPSFGLGFALFTNVKARPLATNFSLPLPVWQQLRTYVDTDLQFKLTPPGTSIKPGSRLLSVRHVEITSLDDLSKVRNGQAAVGADFRSLYWQA